MFWKVFLYLQEDLHVETMAKAALPKTRQESISHELKGFTYKEIDEFHSKSKLQNGQHIIGRMLYLCTRKSGRSSISQVDASNEVAKELVDDWISKNVYPLCEKNVAKKIREDYGPGFYEKAQE